MQYIISFFTPKVQNNSNIQNLKTIYVPDSPVGLHCYAISHIGAKKLLETFKIINYHVDYEIINNSKLFNIYASKEKLGHQNTTGEKSTITSMKFPKSFNILLDKIHDSDNVPLSFYSSYPLIEIYGIQINLLIIIFILLSIFLPTKIFIYFIILLLLIETPQEQNAKQLLTIFSVFLIIHTIKKYTVKK